MPEHQKGFSAHPRGLSRLPSWMTAVFSGLLLVTFGTVRAPIAQASALSHLVTLPDSVSHQIARTQLIGHHNPAASMTVGILMTTNHLTEMDTLLKALEDPGSPLYHHWLKTGEFDQRFGPTSGQLAAVKNFLIGAGLHLLPSSMGEKVVLAVGTSSQLEAAFHTTINDYHLSSGQVFFANSSGVQIPATLQGVLAGVVGLCNAPIASFATSQAPKNHPYYGGGPNGTGLSPSQITGIYDATPLYHAGNTGQGISMAVFELSNYTASDILTYESQFGLPHVPLVDVPVAGVPPTVALL